MTTVRALLSYDDMHASTSGPPEEVEGDPSAMEEDYQLEIVMPTRDSETAQLRMRLRSRKVPS